MAQGMYHRAKPPTSQRGYIRLVIHTRKQKHSSSFIKQALTLAHTPPRYVDIGHGDSPTSITGVLPFHPAQPPTLSELSARDRHKVFTGRGPRPAISIRRWGMGTTA
jgi:hypothetical protein